jgi:hypothetical protein
MGVGSCLCRRLGLLPVSDLYRAAGRRHRVVRLRTFMVDCPGRLPLLRTAKHAIKVHMEIEMKGK